MNELNKINPYMINCGYLSKSTCPSAGTIFAQRTVKWYEIEFHLWGNGYIHTEGKIISSEKGKIFFRKPGMLVQGVAPYHCYMVVFDMVYNENKISSYKYPGFMQDDKKDEIYNNSDFEIDYFNLLDFPVSYLTDQFDKILTIFSELYRNYIYLKNYRQLFLKTGLHQLIKIIIEDLSKQNNYITSDRVFPSNYPKIEKIKRYIDKNSYQKIDLAKLAEIVKLSPNYLCKIFKEHTNKTIISYINENKINTAKKLLIETDKSVKEIAFETGFENLTYFFRLFKKIECLSPVEYRLKHSIKVHLLDSP